MVRSILLLFAVVALAACSSLNPLPCSQQASDFIAETEDILGEWDDANKLAGSTARIGLSPIIADMQDLKQRAEDLEVPECAAETQTSLVTMMDATIDAYLTFASEGEGMATRAALRDAEEAQGQFIADFLALQGRGIPSTAPAATGDDGAEEEATPTPAPATGEHVRLTEDVEATVQMDGNFGADGCSFQEGDEGVMLKVDHDEGKAQVEGESCTGWVSLDVLAQVTE